MKKKIKDLTIDEIRKIHIKYSCVNCPISLPALETCFCPMVLMLNSPRSTQEIYDKYKDIEVEYDDKNI